MYLKRIGKTGKRVKMITNMIAIEAYVELRSRSENIFQPT